MTSHAITLELPSALYQRLEDIATTTHQPMSVVLMQTIEGNLPPSIEDIPERWRTALGTLMQLSDLDLWAVAQDKLSVAHTQRHARLLKKNASGKLNERERAELTQLREATDLWVMRRSFALALLKWRGHTNFDYTKWRQDLFSGMSGEEISQRAMALHQQDYKS